MWQYIGYGNWAWNWDWRHSHKAYIHIASQHIRRSLWGEAASHPGDAAEPFGDAAEPLGQGWGGAILERRGGQGWERKRLRMGSGKAI